MDEVSSHVCLVLPSTDGKAARKIVPPRLRIPYWKGLGADSEEKHEPVSDVDTVVVDGLKALDPKRPIREADIAQRSRHVRFVPDSVAKVFLGERPKFFRTADGFRTWRYGGPHRFTQKRPRSLVWALRSIAVVQPAKSQLLRDFRRRSIFDFCNTIGTKLT